MAELRSQLLATPTAFESIAIMLDEFIDKLQLIWAVNSTNGVVELIPGSLLAREVELVLIRVAGATVAPTEVFGRLTNELNRFNNQASRNANPLFHDILIHCRDLMERWNDQGVWDNIQPIADSLRDVAEVEERRNSVRTGPPAQRDMELLHRLERTMYSDHQLRAKIDTYAKDLEEIIANLQAEKDNTGSISLGKDGNSKKAV